MLILPLYSRPPHLQPNHGVIWMMRKYTLSDEARRARSELMKRLSKDPDFAAKRNAASRNRMKKLNAKAEFKAASSERLKKLHADTKFQKKIKAKVTNAE